MNPRDDLIISTWRRGNYGMSLPVTPAREGRSGVGVGVSLILLLTRRWIDC